VIPLGHDLVLHSINETAVSLGSVVDKDVVDGRLPVDLDAVDHSFEGKIADPFQDESVSVEERVGYGAPLVVLRVVSPGSEVACVPQVLRGARELVESSVAEAVAFPGLVDHDISVPVTSQIAEEHGLDIPFESVVDHR